MKTKKMKRIFDKWTGKYIKVSDNDYIEMINSSYWKLRYSDKKEFK